MTPEEYDRIKRDDYNALVNHPTWCADLLKEAEQSGAWRTGIESDSKRRGSAINTDLYGYDRAQGLAVVQVRQAVFHPHRYTQVRKDYYLIGHSENGQFFAHPVGTPARSKLALVTPEATVAYVLAKIWDCRPQDLPDIERQGDVAFVPIITLPIYAEDVPGPVTLRDTHVLTGDIWQHDGVYYTRRGAKLTHTKGQHAPVRAKGGYYRVQEGIRAPHWGFTAPHGD